MAEMASNKTIRLIITRQDTQESKPYTEEFDDSVSAEYERDWRINGNSAQSGQCQRREDDSSRLGVQLLGGSLWSVLDGD